MKKLLILGGILVVFVVIGLVIFSMFNGARTDGVKREAGLTAQYLDKQNYLSAYVSGFYEQIGVANLKSEKLDQILSDAVKGRYDEGGFSVGSSFFTGIVEAYPNLVGLDIYDKIVDYVSAGREGYRGKQSKLLDMLREYDTWRESGLVHSRIVGKLGFPSERLEARVGNEVWRGKDARDRMFLIVTTSGTRKAYETGTMEPLEIPSEKK